MKRSNTTFTAIVSPSWKVSPLAGEPTKETELTAGTSKLLPSTLWLAPAATAAWVSTAATVSSPAAVMVPPLRRMALAGMPMPSLSPDCTVYVKNRESVLDRVPAYESEAVLVWLPIDTLTWGVPVTATRLSKSTRTSMVSPRW